MKILMLTPYLPYPLMSGGQTRSYNLIKNLSKKHEITLFSLIKNEMPRYAVWGLWVAVFDVLAACALLFLGTWLRFSIFHMSNTLIHCRIIPPLLKYYYSDRGHYSL